MHKYTALLVQPGPLGLLGRLELLALLVQLALRGRPALLVQLALRGRPVLLVQLGRLERLALPAPYRMTFLHLISTPSFPWFAAHSFPFFLMCEIPQETSSRPVWNKFLLPLDITWFPTKYPPCFPHRTTCKSPLSIMGLRIWKQAFTSPLPPTAPLPAVLRI